MEFIALFLIVIVLLFIFIFTFLSKNKSSKQTVTPYELCGPLFTPAERSFYGVLKLACEDKAVVFGKVRIADILKPRKGLNRSQWQIAFNKISAKHFDFVLCNPKDLSVIAVIELDDKSHSQQKQIKRDQFVESACETARLKLHRFKASASYAVDEIKNELFSAPEVLVQVTASAKDNSETCPKCSSELTVKTAKKGKNKGNDFLACSSFPKCRYTREVEL
ncbi:MAG: ssDNA-binding Zn-finger/Zn-ribbon topoisomerase 1 [Paraglaciecola sp.]|jgi:ssDNA-binding Zn-finger/Zn-ribbon topoisomerase 1